MSHSTRPASRFIDQLSSRRFPEVCAGGGEPGLVSVLIPTYNRAYIVGAAIESVLNQTYRPVEIVVVDDGSQDETRSIIEKFGHRVRYIYQDNAGLASARNTGLAVARGEFIAFQDSDDVWVPWKLQVQVALMQRIHDLALTWTDMTAVDEHGTVLRDRYLRNAYPAYGQIRQEETFPNSGFIGEICPSCPSEIAGEHFRYGNIFSAMFAGNLVHPPTVLMRREAVHKAGGLDTFFTGKCEDFEFFSRVARWGQGGVVEAPGMLYRIGAADQFTHSTRDLFQARGYVAVLHRRLSEDRALLRLPESEIHRILAGAYAWLGVEELASDRGRGSTRYLLKSFWHKPFQPQILKPLVISLIPRPLIEIARTLKRQIRGVRTHPEK